MTDKTDDTETLRLVSERETVRESITHMVEDNMQMGTFGDKQLTRLRIESLEKREAKLTVKINARRIRSRGYDYYFGRTVVLRDSALGSDGVSVSPDSSIKPKT